MSKIGYQFFKILVILLVPLVLVLAGVRLLATGPYLAFEYSKSDFPPDVYGFSQSQRLTVASSNLDYVTEHPITKSLAERVPDGASLYDSREVSHMLDVHNVFQGVWSTWQSAFVLFLLSMLVLVWNRAGREVFVSALRVGGLVTAGLCVFLGISAILAWQTWFVVVHQFFFTSGSWLFNYSDTLIRLFPEKLWFDTALTLSSMSIVGGFLIAWLSQLWLKNHELAINAG